MKQCLLALFAAALLAPAASAQTIEVTETDLNGTTLQLQLEDVQMQDVTLDGGSAVIVSLENGHPMLSKGNPDVPAVNSSIIIHHKAATELEVLSSEYYELENVEVAPSKGNLYRNVDPDLVAYHHGATYSQDAFYPGNLATLSSPFVFRDYRGQTVQFNPVHYNPVTKVMRVYTSIEVRVNNLLEQVGENAFEPQQRTTRADDDIYARRFLNYGTYRYDVVSELGDILVISDAEYLETIQPWVDWKIQKGHRTHVTDVADIGNTVESIAAHIADMYDEFGISYIQIVGDEDQVATDLIVNGGGPGFCDNCFGYLEGNDHYPEAMVARFLVHNNDELIPVIQKSLDYARNPDTAEDWASTGMNIGSNEGTGIGDDDQADWEHNNALKQVMMDFTYIDVFEMYDGNHGGDSATPGETADNNGSPSSGDVADVINAGASLINYTGHGYHNGISTSGFDGEDALALSNTKSWPYFIAVACCVGDFDEADGPGDCFGEKWLKATSGGEPVGGIGGSFSSVLQSWAPPMEGQDEMINLITDMGQQEIRHTFGGIHFHGCASMIEEYGSGGEEMMDTWCVFGDGSAVIRTMQPLNLVVDHDEESFIGVDEITVSASVENALIALTLDGEILGTGIIEGGEVTITLTSPIEDVVDIVVTGTAYNTIPYEGIITVLPLEGPWITDDSVAIDDTAGNDNDLADYAEDVMLDISLENVGIEAAMGVEAVITSTNPWVAITDDYHNYGDINPSNIVDAIGGYAFSVVDGVEDQHIAAFEMIVTDTEGNEWTPDFNVVLNAPALDTDEQMVVADASGNGNARLDNGETADMTVNNYNMGHAASVAATATLSTTSPYVTINNPTLDLGVLAVSGDALSTYNVTVVDDAPDGAVVEFVYTVTAGEYQATRTYEEVLNLIIEDWETGDDQSFGWNYNGNADWFVTGSEVYEGAYSMQSGNITHDESTGLVITVDVTTAGPVEFARKTSTEGSYDYLYFFIDGDQMNGWSGENDWEEFSYDLSTGEHTLMWTYAKDFIVSSGEDACWVDDIILPAHNAVVGVEELTQSGNTVLYPNPTRGNAELAWNSQGGTATIEVRNALGQMVGTQVVNAAAGQQRTTLQVAQLPAGVYLIHISQAGQGQTLRLIVE